MGGGSSHDTRNHTEREGWYGNVHRTYDDGTKEERSPGWYDRTNWKSSDGKSGIEYEKGGYVYRKDSDGNCSYSKK